MSLQTSATGDVAGHEGYRPAGRTKASGGRMTVSNVESPAGQTDSLISHNIANQSATFRMIYWHKTEQKNKPEPLC